MSALAQLGWPVVALLGLSLGGAVRAAPAPVPRTPPASRDEVKIEWTATLREANYDTARNRFGRNYSTATQAVQADRKPEPLTIRYLECDLMRLSKALEQECNDLAPTHYIESRRFLNKLKKAVMALSNGSLP